MRTLAKGMDGVNDDGFSQEKRLLAWEHPMTSIQVEHGREKGARRGGGTNVWRWWTKKSHIAHTKMKQTASIEALARCSSRYSSVNMDMKHFWEPNHNPSSRSLCPLIDDLTNVIGLLYSLSANMI